MYKLTMTVIDEDSVVVLEPTIESANESVINEICWWFGHSDYPTLEEMLVDLSNFFEEISITKV